MYTIEVSLVGLNFFVPKAPWRAIQAQLHHLIDLVIFSINRSYRMSFQYVKFGCNDLFLLTPKQGHPVQKEWF